MYDKKSPTMFYRPTQVQKFIILYSSIIWRQLLSQVELKNHLIALVFAQR